MHILGLPDSPVGRESTSVGKECGRPGFNSYIGKIHWRKDRLPTPVFLGFPCGSAGKESIHLQYGRPGFDPWVEKIPWSRERLLTPIFRSGEFHGLVPGVAKVGHN